ncbi:hypothetical protein K32_48570 [Kaistia sp. 32K]|uniref:hypothetical protein n=1 Tax=Kaistia sp. 32K TaxID=2795690 RepID=UPI001916736A|nr:hypothetical protein [Kaistia sp. 32K]BCP56240.1 hypothetical protein K32_48570 [Kaistia sp. 32K]
MTVKISESAPGTNGQEQGSARTRDGWRLEPHCCRACFARIVSRPDDAGRLYQCTNCGAQAAGHKPDVVCACGTKLRRHRGDGRSAAQLVDAGIRCHQNKRVSPEFPALFVASYGGAQAADDE